MESIYVNLYTDSLKKGTFNYINIDGKLSNGKYLPLDSTHLIFWASAGKFSGNSLWIDRNFTPQKVDIKVIGFKKGVKYMKLNFEIDWLMIGRHHLNVELRKERKKNMELESQLRQANLRLRAYKGWRTKINKNKFAQ